MPFLLVLIVVRLLVVVLLLLLLLLLLLVLLLVFLLFLLLVPPSLPYLPFSSLCLFVLCLFFYLQASTRCEVGGLAKCVASCGQF
jgi:hypothetical protein